MTHADVRQTLDSMKLWQKVIVYPLLALAFLYWMTLMAVFIVLCWPAIKFLQHFNLKGLPKPKPLTMFPGKYVN